MKRFEGWYYKHQAGGRALALIPGRADGGAFVQVITDDRAYSIPYPLSAYHTGDVLRVGGCTFSSGGVSLDIHSPDLALTGGIRYTGLTPLRGDIMGPFRFFPMECRHGIISMRHALCGMVTLNGDTLDFNGGVGYTETDSGRSFPSAYTWVQCNDFKRDCSLMASVARIPVCGLRFRGCICAVWLDGREYRLATYNGVRIMCCEPGIIELRQGRYLLSIAVDTREGRQLAAPRAGAMNRVIRESLSCPARIRFSEGETVLFEGESEHTSYEWADAAEDRTYGS